MDTQFNNTNNTNNTNKDKDKKNIVSSFKNLISGNRSNSNSPIMSRSNNSPIMSRSNNNSPIMNKSNDNLPIFEHSEKHNTDIYISYKKIPEHDKSLIYPNHNTNCKCNLCGSCIVYTKGKNIIDLDTNTNLNILSNQMQYNKKSNSSPDFNNRNTVKQLVTDNENIINKNHSDNLVYPKNKKLVDVNISNNSLYKLNSKAPTLKKNLLKFLNNGDNSSNNRDNDNGKLIESCDIADIEKYHEIIQLDDNIEFNFNDDLDDTGILNEKLIVLNKYKNDFIHDPIEFIKFKDLYEIDYIITKIIIPDDLVDSLDKIINYLCSRNDADIISILNKSMIEACNLGKLNTVIYLLKNKFNKNLYKHCIDGIHEGLISACMNNYEYIVSEILIYSVSNKKINLGLYNNLCFKICCKCGHLNIARMLLHHSQHDKRINPGANNNIGFLWACQYNHIEIVKLLLEFSKIDKRINPIINNNEGLLLAIQHKNMEIMNLLVNHINHTNQINN
jgi:hypothetical protein